MNKKYLLACVQAVREADKFAMDIPFFSCGAPACAFGHYASRTDLQDAFEVRYDYGRHPRIVHKENAHTVHLPGDFLIQRHFDITLDQCNELFSADGCSYAQTGDEAATYIELFILTEENTSGP